MQKFASCLNPLCRLPLLLISRSSPVRQEQVKAESELASDPITPLRRTALTLEDAMSGEKFAEKVPGTGLQVNSFCKSST